jgi:hypothetical protein
MAIGDGDPRNNPFISGGLGVVSDMWEQAHQADLAQMMQHAQQTHQFPAPVDTPNTRRPPDLASRARELFLKRMGGIRAELKVQAGDFLACHVHGETVFLFYCFAGREGVAKEHIDMFPSDTFITQFRMILA